MGNLCGRASYAGSASNCANCRIGPSRQLDGKLRRRKLRGEPQFRRTRWSCRNGVEANSARRFVSAYHYVERFQCPERWIKGESASRCSARRRPLFWGEDIRWNPRCGNPGKLQNRCGPRIAEELKEDDLPVLPLPLADQIAREQAITGFLVSKSFSRDLLLQTGAMDEPMNVMRNCMDDLVSSWGIDVVAHKSLARPVHPEDLSEWALQFQRHYPESMLASGRQAIVWRA